MYDYIIEEMADAIANELHVDNNDVLRILHRYWEDKIAHVWRLDQLIHCAFNMGKPILMEHAVGLLDEVFQGAAFALNDVIESINAHETVLAKDPAALAAAEKRRESRIAALEPVLAELVERCTEYIETLKP